MKRFVLLSTFFSLLYGLQAQQPGALALQDCYKLAKENYPLTKQKALVEKSREYSVDNASKGYLPQFSIGGQATYQSDVTQVPIKVPGITIPTMSKDQYKMFGEVNQSLLDWTVINEQKELYQLNAQVENQKIEVELYKLQERINQLFFGILLIDEQLKQAALLKNDLQTGLNKVNGAVANGVSLKSSAQLLQAELLRADQRIIEFRASRRAYAEMLGLFIHQPLNENTPLQNPAEQSVSDTINRLELSLFDAQKKGYLIQNKIISAKNYPKLGLFVQGGYGRPALNMLNNNFDWYYIGGLRMSWNFAGFYTMKQERQLLTVSSNGLDVQKDIFLFNTSLTMKQQHAEIDKLQALLQSDADIIALRSSIKTSANAQLENGAITTNDYLKEVNAEDQAKQNQLLHQVQLLMAQYNFQTTSGN